MVKAQTHLQRVGRTPVQWFGLGLGIVLAVLIQFVGPPEGLAAQVEGDVGAARAAWVVFSLLILMAAWWVTEALPIAVTALLPMVVLPFFGVMDMRAAAAPYMHPIVVLLMGGFIVAKAIERWDLHKRIALNIIAWAGTRPSMLVAGFMAASALLSMWISNTATAIMMTPIALSVAAAVVGPGDPRSSSFTLSLLLGIAYACSIGGLGTPVGTPTNLIIISYLEDNAGLSVGFTNWMMIGVPVVALLVPAGWFVLTQWAYRPVIVDGGGGEGVIRRELAALGALTVPERRTLWVFAVVAFLWVFRRPLAGIEVMGLVPFGGLTDHVTAIFGVVLVFIVPSGATAAGDRGAALLDWKTAETIPWGVVLLFGGGMSLASAISATALGGWIGSQMVGLAALPIMVLIAVLTGFVIFATEVTSNIATASALMPVLGALAFTTGIDVVLLAAPLALAASCAFMLPMATGPNAVVYASGEVPLPSMMRAGVRLNLVAIPIITMLVYALASTAFR